MSNKEYAEKLKSPLWQKRRLEIFRRDDWACHICESKENTLNVHHLYYEKGLDPWDYPSESMITLCEYCHTAETEDRFRV